MFRTKKGFIWLVFISVALGFYGCVNMQFTCSLAYLFAV